MALKYKLTKKEIFTRIILAVASAILYAIAIKCIVEQDNVQMLSNGVGGIAIIISRLSARAGANESLVYSLVYFAINIPIIILSFKRIGKVYTIFTLIDIALASVLIIFIPKTFDLIGFLGLDPTNDYLIIVILAGLLIGVSSGLAFKGEFATGGVDTLIAYMGVKRDKQVGGFSVIINALILIAGGIIFGDWRNVLYTIVCILTSSLVIDAIYIRAKKKLVKIVTVKKNEMCERLVSISLHGITVGDVEGGYSHTHRYMVETTVLAEEVKNIVKNCKEVDPKCFIYIMNVDAVKGNYTMPIIK